MSIFRRIRKRHEELDERVSDAYDRAETARQEADLSQLRHETILHRVVIPLKKAGDHNQFAELIRKSIIDGHHNGVV